MNISRPACIGSTVEASKVRKNRKIFAFKKFILPHCLDSATPPRPNKRDPNRAVKMHRKEEKKRRGKEKRKEEKFGDLIAKKKKKKKEVREHRFFHGDLCAVTFHESNLNGVH